MGNVSPLSPAFFLWYLSEAPHGVQYDASLILSMKNFSPGPSIVLHVSCEHLAGLPDHFTSIREDFCFSLILLLLRVLEVVVWYLTNRDRQVRSTERVVTALPFVVDVLDCRGDGHHFAIVIVSERITDN